MGHEDNFTSWLQSEGACPVCRQDYVDDNFDRIVLKDGTVRQHYLDKSSIFFKRKATFSEFKFRLPFYEFQEEVIDDIIAQLKFDQSHLLTSPPGSGKTIIGLSVASYFSVNTLVLTPNLAVLGSWIDRLSMFYDQDNSQMKLKEVFTRSTGLLKPITISTYQQINTSLRSLDKDRKSGKLRQSPVNYIDRLTNHDIGLVILDEAHRLTGKWGEDIARLLQEFGDVKILGLTATPPQKADVEFDTLFGDRKTEIPLPLMVREGVLVPYRDYAIVLPEKKSDLATPTDHTKYNDMKVEKFNDTEEELQFLIENYERYSDKAYHYRWLSANLSIKTWLTIEIILNESANLGDAFRGLILMDQENIPSKFPFKHTGTGGAIGIFDDLLQIDEIDELDPVFVTGKSLVIDKDFAEFFEEESAQWLDQQRLQINLDIKKTRKQYAIINGSGKDWNTETYTRYVTYLFEKGATKLLLGTRFLLGEGWDSQSLNTVVDLTTFATYSSVNQAKGRALRKDPSNPDKVSHIWEIAPNDSLSPLSHNEYENYLERHDIYFGVDRDGNIRNGVDRINPFLRSEEVLSFNFESQVNSMLDIDGDRSDSIELWQVGEDLGDLYYTIRFGILPSHQISPRIYDQLFELIEFSLRSLLEDIIDVFELEITPSTDDETEYDYQCIIEVPIDEDFDRIREIEESIKTSSSSGLGLYLNLYQRRQLGLWEKIVFWIKNKPVEIYSYSILISLPLQLLMNYLLKSTITFSITPSLLIFHVHQYW